MDKLSAVMWGLNAVVLGGGYFVYDLFRARSINQAKDSFLQRGPEALKERDIRDSAWDFYITQKTTGPFTYNAKKNFKEEVLE